MVMIEISDRVVQNARGVELALLGKNALSDSKLIEYFTNIGMARLLAESERRTKKNG